MTGIRNRSRCSRYGFLFALGVAFFMAPFAVQAADDATTSDPAIATIDKFIAKQNVDKSWKEWKTNLKQPPKASFTADKSYFWTLQTNKGNIKIKLAHASERDNLDSIDTPLRTSGRR